jgi:acyl-CoA reductase-like NAD-dependent aldehyde dehydrogenase
MEDSRTLFIGGQWQSTLNNATFANTNPANGDSLGEVADAGPAEGDRAVEAAAQAFVAWRNETPFARSEILLRAAGILESRAAEWAKTLVAETGSIFGKAMYEVGYASSILRAAAAQCQQPIGELLPSQTAGRENMVERVPAGAVVTISPWNFPLLLSMRGVALPIALGNTVVLKPSEHSPLSGGWLLGKVFEEALLPAGVLNVVTCSRANVETLGNALLGHRAVKRLSFTGSTRVGRILGAKAVEHMIRPVLELGGKDPVIVLEGADLDQAVSAVAFGCFFHQGQICMSTERVIVQSTIAKAFTEKLVQKAKSLRVGDPMDPATQLGPIIHQGQLDEIHAQVEEALADGAELLCGGKPQGLFYPPTVLDRVTPAMRITRDETFGPIAPILTVRDAKQAIEVANDSEYGLSAGVFAANEQQGLAVARRLDSGMVHVNDASVYDEPHCPFGGCKASGLGRHDGQPGVYEFTETRWIGIQRGARGYPI